MAQNLEQNLTDGIEYKPWTFELAMHQTSLKNKERFDLLANKFLANKNADGKKVKLGIYNKCAKFKVGGRLLAQLSFNKNMLRIKFALFEGFNPDGLQLSDKKQFYTIKFKTDKSTGVALELVDKLIAALELAERPRFKPVNYLEQFEYIENLVLVRPERKIKADGETLESQADAAEAEFSLDEDGDIDVDEDGVEELEQDDDEENDTENEADDESVLGGDTIDNEEINAEPTVIENKDISGKPEAEDYSESEVVEKTEPTDNEKSVYDEVFAAPINAAAAPTSEPIENEAYKDFSYVKQQSRKSKTPKPYVKPKEPPIYFNLPKSEEEYAPVEFVIGNAFMGAIDCALYVKKLNSCEHRPDENGILKPILRDVTLKVERGDICGVSGETYDEVMLLVEILANMRPYYTGELRQNGLDARSAKRKIAKDIFYLDGSEMLYPKMNVLEMLMFASAAKRRKRAELIEQQKQYLDLLVSLGLADVALTPIKYLTVGERLIVNLLVAGESKSNLIIANLAQHTLLQGEIEILKNVLGHLKRRLCTVVIASMQPKLIGITCNKAAYIIKGSVRYSGSVDELCKTWDKVVCLIDTSDGERLQDLINDRLVYHRAENDNGRVFVYYLGDGLWNSKLVLNLIADSGLEVTNVKFNKGRVENSFEEIAKNGVQ